MSEGFVKVATLRVGPYQLDLVSLPQGQSIPDGLFADWRPGTGVEPLAGLLNAAFTDYSKTAYATESWKDVKRAIQESRTAEASLAYVEPPLDDEEDRALRDAWLKLTGEDLAPYAVARVGMALYEYPTMPVSWSALQRAVTELESLRASWRPGS